MGTGKTSWVINMLNSQVDKNFLYLAPKLDETKRIENEVKNRKIYCPKNHGNGKLGNISDLLTYQVDIASTHELFRRFDDKCKQALKENKYTLILDETLTAVEPYHFIKSDDYKYLIENHDIRVTSDGLIEWIGSELNTRFDDVRILAKNKCLFKVDEKFFLWHFPHEIFDLFEKVYVLTYLFDGSIMKYYFDLYNLEYETKSIDKVDGEYKLVNYYEPDKSYINNRLKIYQGKLNENISQKENILSATWCQSPYNKKERIKIKNNFNNYCRNIIKAKSNDVMWTSFKNCKKEFAGKGYSNGFVSCNSRSTNDYKHKTCLMYGVNWYENPEIVKFFSQRGICINQDMLALATMLQWIWRSNIREKESNEIVNVYIPSRRMRNIFNNWLCG